MEREFCIYIPRSFFFFFSIFLNLKLISTWVITLNLGIIVAYSTTKKTLNYPRLEFYGSPRSEIEIGNLK